MNHDEIRQSLRQRYTRDSWTQLVRSVFGSDVQIQRRATTIATEDQSIKSIAQLGNVLLEDGKKLAIIEVEVGDDINLLRNRVGLRNRVAKFIDQDRLHGVLAVFNSGRPEYRFSFTARETIFDEEVGMVEKETATRRFTYVLGPDETCNTAAQRFESLSQKSGQIKIDDVIEAFSVEKLNKEFFNTYRDHYERFCTHLLADEQRAATYQLFDIPEVPNAAEQTRLEKPVRDFVKRLLGRIVFLHFLQKKGWMGCPTGDDTWTGGDPDFLCNYFGKTEDKARFHSQRLLPLFYEALNRPHRPDDVFEPSGSRIPYLNGGLFEQIIERESDIDFPAGDFEALLDFFSQYNFTIDENDPNEHEIGIDPEMLGHIFENLLEDNKDKGAYYTPKAIVHYMCQQSLIYYLLRHLGESDEARAALTYLVRNKQVGEETEHAEYIKAHAAEIERLLDQVKICDPAIGSGAFPIGLLQEIFWLKLTLDLTLNQPERLAEIKRAIIQNSIYGVDKDAGAMDIARLRFWLALVVDETEPRPLPNLDYKIMQGDSLLESFEGMRLDSLADPAGTDDIAIPSAPQWEMDLAPDQTQLAAEEQEEKKERITALIRNYFSAQTPEEKRRIHNDIDRFVRRHLDYNLAIAEETCEIELNQHRHDVAQKQKQAPGWTPLRKQAKRMALLEKAIAERGDYRRRLEQLEHEAERPYFLWHLYFQDVFARGGFDIVIANPPYVRQEIIKDYKPLLKAEGYDCFKGTADLFVYFYERSVKMLREGGVLTYITSNKYHRSGYGEKLRGFLAGELTLHEILDFGDAPVFDAIAYASILIGTKDTAPDGHALKAWTWQRGEKIGQVAQVMGEKAFPLQQSNLTPDGWRLERPGVFALLKKLKSKGTPLNEYVDGRFYYGIKTGLNDAFVVDRATRDRLVAEHPSSEQVLKPFLRGRDVKRWKVEPQDLWLIFTRRGIDISRYPAIKKHLEKYKERLMPKPDKWPSDKLWKGRKSGSYRWYEVQDNIAYWQEFERPKVIYPEISEEARFYFDRSSYYADTTIYIIPDVDKAMCAVLNSSVTHYYVSQVAAINRGGAIRWKNQYLSSLPIPKVGKSSQPGLRQLAQQAARAEGPELTAIENEINQIVYRLFDLTPEEIRLIEGN